MCFVGAGGRVVRSAVQTLEYFHSLCESTVYATTGNQRWARLVFGEVKCVIR